MSALPGPPPPTDIPSGRYDIVVVGAGIAGLSFAALMALEGRSVLVLEAIHYPGGCASSYHRDGAWFDTGATTLSGIDPGRPLDQLFSLIGPFDGLLPCRPALSVHLGGHRIDLTDDRGAWVETMEWRFGKGQRPFWREVFDVSDAMYDLTQRARFIPPLSPSEAFRNLSALTPSSLSTAPLLFRTVAQRMSAWSVDTRSFRRFVDAQLLITNQTGAEEALMMSGSLGLSYANGRVATVRGGMIAFARFLEGRARSFGADIAYLQKVTRIRQDKDGWTVRTARGGEILARTVVTQVPLFNLPAITEGEVAASFRRTADRVLASGVRLWGAVTVNALIGDEMPAATPVHQQFILDGPLDSTGSDSLFASVSHPGDPSRAPGNWRTLSISTHVPRTWGRGVGDRASYEELKERAGREILEAATAGASPFRGLRLRSVQVGTPTTFRRYTGRAEGLVGGIPLSRRLFPWRYPRPVSAFGGLYTLGDTFFPGQGLPGVVLGALALARRFPAVRRAA